MCTVIKIYLNFYFISSPFSEKQQDKHVVDRIKYVSDNQGTHATKYTYLKTYLANLLHSDKIVSICLSVATDNFVRI
jgi:hypothetical protein